MVSALKIFLIEDDTTLSAAVESQLGVYNFLRTAQNFREAEKLLQRGEPFDLVILDKRLPDGDATEHIPTIRRISDSTAILVVSGDGDLHSVVGCLKAGADDYLLKGPFFAKDLLARIPVALNSASARKLSRKTNLSPTCFLPADKQAVTEVAYETFLKTAERDFIARALSLYGWDTTLLSKRLGIGRSTLFKKIHDLNISKDAAPAVTPESTGWL